LRLAPRLALTFGLLAAVSTAGVGLAVRERLAAKETSRFQRDVRRICDRATDEIGRQAEADQALIGGACQSGFLVDLVGSSLDRGDLDERRTAYSQMVRTERRAFDVDELLLGIERGDIIGASPTSLLGLAAKDVETLVRGQSEHYTIRLTGAPALVSRCTKRSDRGHIVGLVGARHIDPVLDRLARTLDVTVVPPWPRTALAGGTDDDAVKKPKSAPRPKGKASAGPSTGTSPSTSTGTGTGTSTSLARATCSFRDADGVVLAFDVLKSTKELDDNLHDVDKTVGLYAAISAAVAFIVAVFLARSLGRPLSVLATEAGKVAAGEARPIRASGSGEVSELASAFDRMIQDLAVTRRRLAAASRVAAWREVARRVAHEVKNPLAPIRAAVETLRRLRSSRASHASPSRVRRTWTSRRSRSTWSRFTRLPRMRFRSPSRRSAAHPSCAPIEIRSSRS
jgi:two-component system, NtrC family, nitrogen regulation sensor histidine kinase NtrY